MKYYDITNTLICSLCCQEFNRTVPYNYRYESFLTELLYQPANSSAQVKCQNITLDCGQWAYRCWIVLLWKEKKEEEIGIRRDRSCSHLWFTSRANRLLLLPKFYIVSVSEKSKINLSIWRLVHWFTHAWAWANSEHTINNRLHWGKKAALR